MTKHIKIIFTLSILLNLILIGTIGAHNFKKYQRDDFPAMSEKTRELIEGNLKLSRADRQEKKDEMRAQRDNLKRIVTAQDFDLAAYNKAINQMLESRHEGAKQKAAAIGKVLSELPYAERIEFSEHMMRQISDEGRGHKERSPKGRDFSER